jgi:hypothetical protein
MSKLVTVRDTCRLCGSARIVLSVPLAQVPIVSPNVAAEGENASLAKVVAPLDNYLCEECGLNQLVHVVDPSLIYRNYLDRTQVSLGLAEHFRGLRDAVAARLPLRAGDLVVEFGSNDGTLLGFFKEAGARVQGVDPATRIAAEATGRGIPTRADFFGRAVAAEIVAESGRARAVLANNAMANIDDLDEILAGVKLLLDDDGLFVFETQYALDVFEKTLLDVIYHEHITTFSVRPVVRSFARHGLAVIDAERIPTKGGSIRFWIQRDGGPRRVSAQVAGLVEAEERAGLYDRATHARFAERVAGIKRDLHAAVDAVRAAGGRVAGYGASVGCAALIHQFELEGRLEMLFDDKPFKSRLAGPGYDLPVFTSGDLMREKPDLVVILAWRYAEPIMRRNADYLAAGGRFAVSLPAFASYR